MHESEKWKWSCSVMSDSYRPHGLQPTRLPSPWEFPGKSTGVGCHCLLRQMALVVKKHACQHKRLWCGLIPGFGRSPGEGNDNPLQYSCLENLMEGGAWRATVHRVMKSLMWWKWLCTHMGNQWVWTLWIWHDSTAKSTLEPVPSPGTWKTVN